MADRTLMNSTQRHDSHSVNHAAQHEPSERRPVTTR